MNAPRVEATRAANFRIPPGSGLRERTGFASALVLAAAVSMATPALAQTTALNFTDPLTGTASPSYLTVPTAKYSYGPTGLIRSQSNNGATYGNGDPNSDRPMVKTVSGAFLSEDFEFDVDVNAPATNTDLIYVGFGQGIANPGYFNEPTESFEFRIHNNIGGFFGIHAAVDVGLSSNPFASIQQIGNLQSGVTTTFRIVRSGNSITLSIPSQPGSLSASFPLTMVPSLNSTNAYLFFGNTATGTTFSNVRVIAARDTTPPVISKLTASPAIIWPPNHKMVPVTLNAVATDNVGVTSLKILSVTVKEADDRDHEGKGEKSDDSDRARDRDGARSDDYKITGNLTLALRAEGGNVYTITVQALDAAGNAATKSVTVTVPRDKGYSRIPF